MEEGNWIGLLVDEYEKNVMFLPNGVIRYVSKEENCDHYFQAPLEESEYKKLERQLGRRVPKKYQQIIEHSNGMLLYNRQLQIFSFFTYSQWLRSHLCDSVVLSNMNPFEVFPREWFFFARDTLRKRYFVNDRNQIVQVDENGVRTQIWSSLYDWFEFCNSYYVPLLHPAKKVVATPESRITGQLQQLIGKELQLQSRFLEMSRQKTVEERFFVLWDSSFECDLFVLLAKKDWPVYIRMEDEDVIISPSFSSFLKSLQLLKKCHDTEDNGDTTEQLLERFVHINRRKGLFYWASWLDSEWLG